MFRLNGKHLAMSLVSNSYFSSKMFLIDLIANPLSLPWIQFRTYVLTKNTGLFHLNESGICGYSTVVILLRHEHVAVIAPVGGPGVLN